MGETDGSSRRIATTASSPALQVELLRVQRESRQRRRADEREECDHGSRPAGVHGEATRTRKESWERWPIMPWK
jgi:hypothetical protein